MDEGLLNDLLECSVCLERLDTSSRVLPCQHTFCIQCLREIIYCQKELRCPECRVLVETPVEELPPNVLLMRILEGMRNSGNLRPPSSPPPAQVIPRRPIIGPATFMEPVSSYGFTYSDGDGKHTNVIPKCTPHARAICDYFSKEPGDLNFKKGEVIILRRQIDTYWFHGETGGNQGAFPITFAKVVVHLPPPPPQCTALYDFHMAAHDDEGCLAFNKGAVINVIRRVDENWAEGRLHDKIGIFPIAFAEMNLSALSIINISTNIGCNDRGNHVNKAVPRSCPGPLLNKSQQSYGQKHNTQRTVIPPNQIAYRQQQMSASSPVPNLGVSLQRQQQNMSQSHPNYSNHQFPQDTNQSAAPYVDLAEAQDRAMNHLRNLNLDSPNPSSDVRGQSSGTSQNDKSRGTNTKFSNLTSSYHPTNNLSSDSSSTTTTPSLGGSSVTTTPNTSSSNTSSASESNTPSSPASPATNAVKSGGNNANNQNISANQPFAQNNYYNIVSSVGQSMSSARNVLHGNSPREDTANQSDVSLNTSGTNSMNSTMPNSDVTAKNISSSSSPLQNQNGNNLNATPPRSNMSSPQTCVSGQDGLHPTSQGNSKNISPSLNVYSGSGVTSHNVPLNALQPKLDIIASSSNQPFNTYNLGDQHGNDQLVFLSPRHGGKDGPLSNTPRSSHSHHHRDKEKRNSLTPGGQISSAQTSVNRHSAEILGPCSNLLDQEINQNGSAKHDKEKSQRKERDRHEKEMTFAAVEKYKEWEKERSKRGQAISDKHQAMPYVALYPYKPQKPDELELKKGVLYMVLEQCQDGWFKGCSNSRPQKCGVFPGNYVFAVSKAQMASYLSSTKSKQHATAILASGPDDVAGPGSSKSSKDGANSSSKTRGHHESHAQPPDLPPRSQSPSQLNSNASPGFHWTASPKGSSSKSNDKQKEKSKADKNSGEVSLMKRLTWGMKKSRSPPPSTHGGTFSMDNPVFEDTPEVFPPSGSHNQQQPMPQQALHMRSGSCPSQLLQGVPSSVGGMNMQTMPHHYKNNEMLSIDNTVYGNQLPVGGSISSAVAHRLFPTHQTAKGMGSQTLGPSHGLGSGQRRQPRPTVLNALAGPPDAGVSSQGNFKQGYTVGRSSGDVPWLPVSTRHHHHRKSHSLDAGQQLKSGKENSHQIINKRYRCIVAYPTTSEYELELQVDDVILVHKQLGEGWYKGTLERTGHTGLVPASFVEAC